MLIYNKVRGNNGQYKFNFDMSGAKSDIYLVKIGSATFGKVKKIVVK